MWGGKLWGCPGWGARSRIRRSHWLGCSRWPAIGGRRAVAGRRWERGGLAKDHRKSSVMSEETVRQARDKSCFDSPDILESSRWKTHSKTRCKKMREPPVSICSRWCQEACQGRSVRWVRSELKAQFSQRILWIWSYYPQTLECCSELFTRSSVRNWSERFEWCWGYSEGATPEFTKTPSRFRICFDTSAVTVLSLVAQ